MANTQVGGAALLLGVERGPAPHGEQRLLGQVLGGGGIGAPAHHVGLHARPIGLIKLAERRRVRLLRHAPQQVCHDAAHSPGQRADQSAHVWLRGDHSRMSRR